MTLENLVQVGRLKEHKATREEILKLLEAARRNLKDARVPGISAGTRFDAAYKAVMQCALLALLACGFRPSTSEPGHHVTTIQSLPKTIGLSDDRLVVLDSLRKRRNLSDYSGEEISDEQASACIRAAEALFADIEAWLRATHSDFLS